MYKLIDKSNGVIHQMNEEHVREYVKESLEIESEDMNMEEIQDVLHFHDYSLERDG